MHAITCGGIFIAVFAVSSLPLGGAPAETTRSTQNPQRPMPKGRMIDARDGDTIVLDGDERIRIVRRNQAIVRAVFNEGGRWLILLADVAQPDRDPDGRVDVTYNFRDLTGNWPLGARWEGQVVIEEHSADQAPQRGMVLRTVQGAIQLVSGNPHALEIQEPAALAVLHYRGAGRGSSMTQTFDQAEQRAVAELERNIEINADRAGQGLPSMSTFSTEGPTGRSATGTLVGPYISASPRTGLSGFGAPVRVGGHIASPRRIYDVPPVLPEVARRAGVLGPVILELTIGADGAVADAKVLRSIPLLDKAALDAARQWRYEPTLLNNQPVPVIMTAVVNFQ
ncbi:MAG: energy transducer TonB [Vicinamibacterales bacterium]